MVSPNGRWVVQDSICYLLFSIRYSGRASGESGALPVIPFLFLWYLVLLESIQQFFRIRAGDHKRSVYLRDKSFFRGSVCLGQKRIVKAFYVKNGASLSM